VPLSRPRSFAGRDAQLAQLRAHVSSEGGERLAVYGLGGCGKTALALEFAYWTQEQDPMRAVFWIPAISRESFEQAFHEIATMLCIQGIEDDKTDVKQKADAKRLVKARLSDEEFGKWLIIVDNADDTGILLGDDKDGSSTQHLISDLPRSGKGSIIFTTRTRAAAIELAEDRIIALGEFENAEAIEILHKRLLPEHQHELRDNDTVNEFLGLLLFHALAIVQAIAFVNTNDVTLFDYISLYRNSERDAIELLSEEFEEQGRYREATNSIATTWFISFEQIQKKDKIAAAHLFFMACIANNDIEPSIFPPQYSQTEHVKALGTLKAHAFITERQPRAGDLQGQGRKVSKTFDVHRLVHLTIRGWLKGRDQWQSQISTTLTRFIEIVPHGDHDMRKYWTAYLHHAIHLADLPEAHALVDRATLLDWIAECKRSLGRYQAAERAYRQAFEQREIMLGKGNRDTISTLGNLGQILGYQERWVEAEIIHRKVLALMETFIGKEDQHTLTCRGDLAMALLGQSKTLEAEKMYQGLLLLNQKVHGNKHPQTLTTMHNIGATLVRQGKYADAEQLLRETLALNKEVQGEDHEYTLSNMGLLGSALSYQSKYAEAEAIHKEELALKNKVMVEGHPESLRCMRRVGLALSSQQKYVEAEQVLRKALSLSEKVHGNTSLSTLRSKYALAKTLRAQMKYTESEQLLRETLAIEDTVLGKNHVDTIYSVSLLAALAHDQMQYEEALPLYERACAGFHSTLGPNHPTTIECLENYTWIQRVVEEDRVAAASKAKRVIANTTEDPIVAGSAGLPSSSTAEVALRPQERWRQKMKKWRKK
jgi:tetratricopeptide (TPR) repeat protein